MAYFIFGKNLDNIDWSICKIAENQNDLNNLNIIQSDYKIIEESQSNFDLVKYGSKFPKNYNNNTITYKDISVEDYAAYFKTKNYLNNYVTNLISNIKLFLDNNPNHPSFNIWNNYLTQLNNFNLDNITYPFNKSLEQYFKDQNLTSLNILQLP